jgi:hypothetical protein
VVLYAGADERQFGAVGGSNGQGCGATKKICALPASILPARGSRRFIADPSGAPTPISVGSEQHNGERGGTGGLGAYPYPYLII